MMYEQKDTKSIWPRCSENHSHEEQFIPIRQLKLEDLPEGFCKSDTLEVIKLLSKLTVRIVVRSTKDKANNRDDKNMILAGTGTVLDVIFKNQIRPKGHCKRLSTQTPGCMALIRIKTACHVVSSDSEAKNSLVNFFYDDAYDLRDMKTLPVVRLDCKSAEEDWSVVECFTCDMALANVLRKSIDSFLKQAILSPKEEGGLAVVVSHPHGLTKHVSIGQWSLPHKSVTGTPNTSRNRKQTRISSADFPVPRSTIEDIPDVGKAHHLIDLLMYNPGFIEKYSYHLMLNYTISIIYNVFSLKTVNQNGKSEVVGIECEVAFPDGEISKRQIWRFDKPVKETKKFLMSEGNINFPEEEVYLELELPNGQTQIMEDSKEIDYYWDDLSIAIRICMRKR